MSSRSVFFCAFITLLLSFFAYCAPVDERLWNRINNTDPFDGPCGACNSQLLTCFKWLESGVSNTVQLPQKGGATIVHSLGGIFHTIKNSPDDTHILINEMALKGNAWAQCMLGFMYDRGIVVDEDVSLAFEWYKKSADQQYPQGLCNTGVMYLLGRGVEADDERSFHYFSFARHVHLPCGMLYLGCLYLKGIYAIKNRRSAITFLKKAAEGNEVWALCALGVIYEKTELSTSIEYYERASALQSGWALWRLGICINKAPEFYQDNYRQFDCYKASAALEHPYGTAALANCYVKGIGVAKNSRKAREHYRWLVDQGYKKYRALVCEEESIEAIDEDPESTRLLTIQPVFKEKRVTFKSSGYKPDFTKVYFQGERKKGRFRISRSRL